MKHDFDKLFSISEANELIPRLEMLIREVQTHAALLREKIVAVSERNSANGIRRANLEEIVNGDAELHELAGKIAGFASQIESLGCFLKDIELGLIDIPYERDDEVVFLCWQFGEREIHAWHRIGDGFGGRQPLYGVTSALLN